MADGLQGAEAVAPGGGAVVGAGRSQPLLGGAGGGGQHAQRGGAGTVGKGVSALRGAGGDADGPRGAMVECAVQRRHDGAVGMADATGRGVALEPGAASANAGQSGAVSRRVAAGAGATAGAGAGGAGLAG